MPSQSALQVADLSVGDEIQMYVIASQEGWEWVSATVLDTDPLRIRWSDGEEKAWARPGARIPNIRRKPEPTPPPSSDAEHFELFDADGDGLRIGPPGEYAQQQYQALIAVDNGAVYLRHDQVEALRDYLTAVLNG